MPPQTWRLPIPLALPSDAPQDASYAVAATVTSRHP